jgi:raffinose/stachyose/melibiose transport system substrate-binding protein
MKRLSRMSLLAASLALIACALIACGDDSSDDTPRDAEDAASAGGKVEGKLSFWYVPTDPSVGEWWDAFVAAFEAKHPGTTIEVTRNAVDNYQAKTLAAFSSGDQPDVIAMDTGEYLNKFVRAGHIADVRQLADLELYNPAAVDVLNGPDDQVYGVPEYSFVITLWRNTGLFEEHGLAAPKTWEELLAACETFRQAGVTPIAFGDGGQDQWTAGHWFSALLYQYGGVGADVAATYGDDGASWSDPPFVQAATRLRELADGGCFPDGFTGLNYGQMSSLFQRGKAAMIFTGSWFAAEVASAKDVRVDVVPVPDAPDAAHSGANLDGVVAGVSAITASREAVERKPALVKAFLDAFGRAADDYANENSLLSVAREPAPSGGPVQQAQTEQLRKAGELVTVTDVAVPAPMIDDFYEGLQALLAGDLSPEDFAQTMADAAERERPNLPTRAGDGS